MSEHTRREFIQRAAVGGVALFAVAKGWTLAKSPNQTVNFACIGVGGKGRSDMEDAARIGNIVAICDIDDNTLNEAGGIFPNAKKYNDFRKMLNEMGKDIDAVTVSTPDHTHAVAAGMAMNMGMHCFCQKPLTHSIWEARRLGEIAKKNKLATQMGNQGTANSGLRMNAALLRAGALGRVSEVHVWTNRPVWPQGNPRPAPKDPPPHVHWDLFLGPAKHRPYGDGYHPFSWRGWWDFGTGALGDMGCHTMNMPFMGLDLKNPTSVVAETSGHNGDSYPRWSIVHYEFPATRQRPAIKFTWYDGGKKVPAEWLDGERLADSGCLVIGDRGKLYSPGDNGGEGRLLGNAEFKTINFEESPGHMEELGRMIKDGKPAVSNFPDYASPLSEVVLLGNLAVFADGKKIEWDARRLVAKNAPELQEIVRHTYREGWNLL